MNELERLKKENIVLKIKLKEFEYVFVNKNLQLNKQKN